jgi:hypothetical protein
MGDSKKYFVSNLWPSMNQWNRWTLPSKWSFIGGYLTLIALVFSGINNVYRFFNPKELTRQDFENYVSEYFDKMKSAVLKHEKNDLHKNHLKNLINYFSPLTNENKVSDHFDYINMIRLNIEQLNNDHNHAFFNDQSKTVLVKGGGIVPINRNKFKPAKKWNRQTWKDYKVSAWYTTKKGFVA